MMTNNKDITDFEHFLLIDVQVFHSLRVFFFSYHKQIHALIDLSSV